MVRNISFCLRQRVVLFVLSVLFFPQTSHAGPTNTAVSVLAGVRLTAVTLRESPLEEVRLHHGLLNAREGMRSLSERQLIGAIFIGIDNNRSSVQLKIGDLVPNSNDPEIVYYRFEYWRASISKWENACLPDAQGNQGAILINGTWDERGDYHSSDSLFTLGCTSSVVGKCALWGYKPWKTVQGRSLQPFHQACTRMARADYLGNGETHTKEGVPIFFTDTLGINQGESPNGMSLEATWGPEGAYSIYRLRFPDLRKWMTNHKKPGEVLLINYSQMKGE